MKIALAQVAPALGDLNKNRKMHLKYIEKASAEKADILIFPELSLTGYSLQHLIGDAAIDTKSSILKEMKEASRSIAIVFGFVEEGARGIFYNSAAFLQGGSIAHIHRKVFLPNYGMFEEAKFFAPGREFHAADSRFGRMGFMICYDFLHYGACYLLHADRADLIIVLSAAPGRGHSEESMYASSRMWELMGEAVSRFSTSYVIYCNRAGHEDGKIFAGGSFIYDPMGELEIRAPYIEEDFLIHDIDLKKLNRARKTRHYRRDDRPEIILQSLQKIVRGNGN